MHIGIRAYLGALVPFTLIALSSAAAEPIRIGALTELSGPFAGLGEECKRGYDIAEANFLSDPQDKARTAEFAQVIYGDHQRVPKVGISEFRRLIDQENSVAVIANGAPVVMALNPISRQLKIPLVGAVVLPAFTSDNPYAFRVWPSAEREGAAIADVFSGWSAKRPALVTLLDEYPVSVSDVVRRVLKERGAQLVADEEIQSGTTDFLAVVTRLKAVNPDVVFVNVIGDSLPVILRRLREQSIAAKLIGTFSLARADIRAAAGQAAEEVNFLEVDGNYPRFLAELKRRYGADQSTGLNFTCYVGLTAALQAARAANGDKQLFTTTLLATSSIELLDGPLEVVNREAQMGFIRRQVRAGVIVDTSK